jgi:hypothetical protein
MVDKPPPQLGNDAVVFVKGRGANKSPPRGNGE